MSEGYGHSQPNSFNFEDRKLALSKFKQSTQAKDSLFDLVIIGGGINGAGVARDAALRGLSVALVEERDFSSGTSSRSSKLVHGGIRYLENLEFHLVFEALNERTKLFTLAPNLVHPLRFMIPLYKGDRVGMLMLGLGMTLYDALSLWQAPELYERLSANGTHKRMPALQADNLLGSYVYSDAYMDDDRLTLETLRSAHAAGAHCANYVQACGAVFDDHGQVVGVQARDMLTGDEFVIRARRVVSCVGPWTDELGQKFFTDWKRQLRPTKGVHLTFAKHRFPLSSAVVMAEKQRIIFAIPRHEMVIVGTTDTDYPGDPAKVEVTAEDVDYLLKVTSQYFPGAKLTKADILGCYAGVRPLVHDGAQTEGKTSREHTIFTDKHAVTYVMGGKYTTYRLISEQVVKEVLRGRSIPDRIQYSHSRSEEPLNPLITEESYLQKEALLDELLDLTTCSETEARLLLERHGAEAVLMARKIPHAGFWELEVNQAVDNSMCLNALDFYTRRFPLTLAYADHGLSRLDEICGYLRSRFQWSDSEAAKQRQSVLDFLHLNFAFLKKQT